MMELEGLLVQWPVPHVAVGMILRSLSAVNARVVDLTSAMVGVKKYRGLDNRHWEGLQDLVVVRLARLEQAENHLDLELWENIHHHLKQFDQFWAMQEEKLRHRPRGGGNLHRDFVEKACQADPTCSDWAVVGSRVLLTGEWIHLWKNAEPCAAPTDHAHQAPLQQTVGRRATDCT